MHSPVAYVACCLLFLAGCGKKQDSPPAASGDSGGKPMPAAAAGPAEAIPAAAKLDPSAAMLSQLTQIVRRFAMERQHAPKSLDELVTAGYLPSLPPVPDGKALAISKNLEVYLAGKQ